MESSPRFLSDAQLLAQCRIDIFRGPGPGGQKRNKTSNSVRLTHEGSGVQVIAGESRSLAENKTGALRRMRLKLSADLREPVDVAGFSPPDWVLEIRRNGRIEASHRHPFYAAAGGLVLDLMNAMAGNPASVAAMLGVPTTAVIRLLEAEPHWWSAANAIRQRLSMPRLTHRR